MRPLRQRELNFFSKIDSNYFQMPEFLRDIHPYERQSALRPRTEICEGGILASQAISNIVEELVEKAANVVDFVPGSSTEAAVPAATDDTDDGADDDDDDDDPFDHPDLSDEQPHQAKIRITRRSGSRKVNQSSVPRHLAKQALHEALKR